MADRPTPEGVEPSKAGIEITPEMVNAGVAEISGFELIDASEGFLPKAELVRAIYSAMIRVAPRRSL